MEAIKTTFKGKQVIKLKSGETINLIELPKPGISSTQTVVRIDKSGDLIVGDLAHTRHHTWLEGGIVDGKPTPDLAGWKADLKVLPTLGKGKVYGGRGDFVPVKEAVAQEVAYLEKADQIVDGYLKALGPRVSELNDSEKKGAHFAAIQAEFVKAFPDYCGVVLVLRQRDKDKKSKNSQQNHKLSHKNTSAHVASSFDRKRARLTKICKKMREKRPQPHQVCGRLNARAPDELNLPPKPHHTAHHSKISLLAWVYLGLLVRRICR